MWWCVRSLVSLSWGRRVCQKVNRLFTNMVNTSGSYEMCQDAGRSVRELVCKVSKCLSVRGLFVSEVKKCLMGPPCWLESFYYVRGSKACEMAGSVSLPALSPCWASWQSSQYRRGLMLGKSTPCNRANTRVKTKHQGHWSTMTKCHGEDNILRSRQQQKHSLNKTLCPRPNVR